MSIAISTSAILSHYLGIKRTPIASGSDGRFYHLENLAFYFQKRTFFKFSCFQIFRLIDCNYFFCHNSFVLSV